MSKHNIFNMMIAQLLEMQPSANIFTVFQHWINLTHIKFGNIEWISIHQLLRQYLFFSNN